MLYKLPSEILFQIFHYISDYDDRLNLRLTKPNFESILDYSLVELHSKRKFIINPISLIKYPNLRKLNSNIVIRIRTVEDAHNFMISYPRIIELTFFVYSHDIIQYILFSGLQLHKVTFILNNPNNVYPGSLDTLFSGYSKPLGDNSYHILNIDFIERVISTDYYEYFACIINMIPNLKTIYNKIPIFQSNYPFSPNISMISPCIINDKLSKLIELIPFRYSPNLVKTRIGDKYLINKLIRLYFRINNLLIGLNQYKINTFISKIFNLDQNMILSEIDLISLIEFNLIYPKLNSSYWDLIKCYNIVNLYKLVEDRNLQYQEY